MSNEEKDRLLDTLYEVLHSTESEEAFKIIGDTIDFIKRVEYARKQK